jgi:hypothetical protein
MEVQKSLEKFCEDMSFLKIPIWQKKLSFPELLKIENFSKLSSIRSKDKNFSKNR